MTDIDRTTRERADAMPVQMRVTVLVELDDEDGSHSTTKFERQQTAFPDPTSYGLALVLDQVVAGMAEDAAVALDPHVQLMAWGR